MSLLVFPFIIHAVLMGIDEYLHHQRGLGTWERIGHPLDTITVLVPITFIAMNEFNDRSLFIYLSLAIFSCVFITKDEFIHGEFCGKVESWIHALLFILHPVIFLCAGLMWLKNDVFLNLLPCLIGLFLLYQIICWSLRWKPQLK